MTSAVRSSIAASYRSSGIVMRSDERNQTSSAPVFAAHACHTCPSVGKSSSESTIRLRSPERSMAEATVESAIETFVVSAISSASHPPSSAKDRFSRAMAGKMSSNHTWSGAPFSAHALT